MDNKTIFNTAHSHTRAIVAKNPALKYRVVFSFQLKKAIAEQHKKVTTLHANALLHADKSVTITKPKKINKKVALVGDSVNNADLASPFFMMSLMLINFAMYFIL